MAQISNIQEITAAADPVDIIGRRIPIKKEGSYYVGRCPFHANGQERSPSLNINPAKGWYCHGPCKTGGDSVGFIMKYENLDFVEAIEVVAAEVGKRVEYDQTGDSKNQLNRPRRQQLYEAIAAAAKHYTAELEKHKNVIKYTEERGLDADTRKKYQIGYAKGNTVRDVDIDNEILLEAGIIKKSEKHGDLYDPLAGRLIITLADTTGRPIGFIGRKLPQNESAVKYINTADTTLYRKRNHLFGYHTAVRIIRGHSEKLQPRPVVVEGQLNAIACHRQGIPAVAPGGSTLTERQALLLQRLGDDVHLAYDADAAGVKATVTAARELRKINVTVRCNTLYLKNAPDGLTDPDELHAAGHSITYTDTDFISWAVRHLLTEDRGTPSWAREITSEILPLINEHPDEIVREIEQQILATDTGLSIQAIRQPQKTEKKQKQPPAERDKPDIDTAMTPTRYLCAVALQADLTGENAKWPIYMRALDLPKSALPFLSDIHRVRIVAHNTGCSVSTAIRRIYTTLAHPEYLLHWSTVELPGPPDISGFCRVQDRVCTHETNRRYQKGELI